MSSEKTPGRIQVLIFFSHGATLEGWEENGIFDREVGYYKEIAESAGSLSILTYDRGGRRFEELRSRASPVSVLRNDTGLPYQLFGLLAPIRHYRALRRADVFRTNQFSGAWVGVLAKWVSRKPLIVRGGFVRTQFLDRDQSTGRVRRAVAGFLEGFSLRRADAVIVTTPADRDHIVERYRLDPARVWIVPNPIDIEKFRPGVPADEEQGLVLTVGRLVPQKNLPALIEAMASVQGARLAIAGTGPDENDLRATAGPEVEFLGRVPNSQIAGLLRKAQVFVLASHYEGSPKALLEAMASGKAVIGADSPGIREVIQDGVNGLLVPGESGALAGAITRLSEDAELRARLGAAARNYVEETNSLATSVARETGYLRQVAGKEDALPRD